MNTRAHQQGLTVLEILISVGIGAVLVAGLMNTVGQTLNLETSTRARTALLEDARFAMDRMLDAVGKSRQLILPLADNPATTWREHVREQTIPASTPEPGSNFASAVLAVSLPTSVDIDSDGWSDANNDRDYQDLNGNAVRDPGEPERIDEDYDSDMSSDGAPGIVGIDDDGDGLTDISAATKPWEDDDEDDDHNEDNFGGGDEDGDGSEDEDTLMDMNFDSAPGVAGVDDDNDGDIDEGNNQDDDEDGSFSEDWLDPLVFYLQADGDLIERRPVPYDANASGGVDGLDFVESVIATNVSLLHFERVPAPAGGVVTVDITLELTGADAATVSVQSRARLGGRR